MLMLGHLLIILFFFLMCVRPSPIWTLYLVARLLWVIKAHLAPRQFLKNASKLISNELTHGIEEEEEAG